MTEDQNCKKKMDAAIILCRNVVLHELASAVVLLENPVSAVSPSPIIDVVAPGTVKESKSESTKKAG